MNSQLAIHIIGELLACGVKEFCICPGARNAPLIAVLTANPGKFRSYYFFEERSAGFFALGRIRNTGNPVAIVTTSGTAAGELLPATMEAHYSGLPLVLVTADRPRRYRGSGAPQTAEQVGLYGPYVSHSVDIEEGERPEFNRFLWNRPIHFNVCFDEPLLEAPQAKGSPYLLPGLLEGKIPGRGVAGTPENRGNKASRFQIEQFFEKVQYPLVIVGLLHPSEREAVADLLLRLEIPTYFEALSGLREDARFNHFRIHLSDRVMERALRADYRMDGVIRVGGVPTLRLWRDLDLSYSHLPVLSLSPLPFTGLGRPSSLVQGPLPETCNSVEFQAHSRVKESVESQDAFLKLDCKAMDQLRELLRTEPLSEPGMIADLSSKMSLGSRVYLGNSLPIREWDLAAVREAREFNVWGSRGLNGIDGQVSTFLGFAEPDSENWAVIGDLTALYDLPGPWILSQMPETKVNILLINNGGGKIFSRIFSQTEFQNRHQLRFGAWAELWGLKYERWNEVPQQIQKSESNRLIEMIPDEEATLRFWKRYEEI